MVEKLPFEEKQLSENVFIRLFPMNVDFDELKWHWDEEDREFEILEGVGWWFQRDNDLPIEMKIGDIIKVSKGEWHRAIKDKNTNNDLVIKLTKF